MVNVILQGLDGGSLILQGYSSAPNEVRWPTLGRAIIERFKSSGYYDLLPGGLHYASAPNTSRNRPPYGVIQEVTETLSFDTRGPSYNTGFLQASFFAPQGFSLELSQIKQAWYAVFSPRNLLVRPILWDGYRLIRFANADARLMEDEGDAPAGPGTTPIPMMQQIIEFVVIYSPSAN